jgi:ssDNA-binding Zn-finger/Zn-ribbon topoisomerase 1
MKCPKCNSKMVEKINHKTNEKFLGCSKFPSCHGSRNLDGTIKIPKHSISDELDRELGDWMGFTMWGDN